MQIKNGKRVIISSGKDQVSLALGRKMLEMYKFSNQGNGTSFTYDKFILIFIEDIHLNYSNINNLGQAYGDVMDVIILSRHSSAANVKSMTVHPTGNFGEAKLGGESGRLSVSDPAMMSETLRTMKSLAAGTDYSVTFEATHHGPLSDFPMFYAEIGTVDDQWKEDGVQEILIKSIMESREPGGKSYVGVGGGHYMPKVTSMILSSGENAGHMISKHAAASQELIGLALNRTPGASGFILDRKGTTGETRNYVRNLCDEKGLELITV